jgi:hypothetical protein
MRKCSKRCSSLEKPKPKRLPKSNKKRFLNADLKCKILQAHLHQVAQSRLFHLKIISLVWDRDQLRLVIILLGVVVALRSPLKVQIPLEIGWMMAQVLLKLKRHQAKGCNLANPKNRMNS